jgi:hypothetical protein
VKYDLLNIDSSFRSRYHFMKFTPQASFGYRPKAQTSLSFNYRGTTRQPSLDQLQPIRDNSDRLSIFIGNPRLKVAFNHNFSLFYNSYKMLSQSGVFANISYNIPVNAIAYFNVLDVTIGKQTYTPVNVNGNRNFNGWFEWFKDGGEKKLGYGIDMSSSGGRSVSFTNGLENTTRYVNTSAGFFLRYGVTEKYNIDLHPNMGYNTSKSSLNASYNTKYWSYGGRMEGSLNLDKKTELKSDVNFDFQQQLEAFNSNPNQIVWNASLSRQIFKDKSGKIYLIANDILDQQRGFNRNITSNFISEEKYSRISRYFLLKFEWSFNKMPGMQTK